MWWTSPSREQHCTVQLLTTTSRLSPPCCCTCKFLVISPNALTLLSYFFQHARFLGVPHADNKRNNKVTKHRCGFVIKSNYEVKKHLVMTQKMWISTNYKVKKHRGDACPCGFCDFDDTCRQCEKVFNSITKWGNTTLGHMRARAVFCD